MKKKIKFKKEYNQKLKIKHKLDSQRRLDLKKKGLKSFKRISKYLKGESRFFDRNIVYAHLGFEKIASSIAKRSSFPIISGKNPSTSLHLGHLIIFKLIKDLQSLGGEVVIPLTNDESYIDEKVENFRKGKQIAQKSIIPDILALGLDPQKTRIFIHTELPELYVNAMYYGNLVSLKVLKSLFGENSINTVSKAFYRGSVQMSSILMLQNKNLFGKRDTLVPVGIDQHPYILLTRDVAKKVKLKPPSEIIIENQLNLRDPLEKMSSSTPASTIFLDDNQNQIEEKIMNAYTGSLSSLKAHQEFGAIPEICSVFQILRFHMEDDQKLKIIYNKYKGGIMKAVELKKFTVEYVLKMIKNHANKREQITNSAINSLKLNLKN